MQGYFATNKDLAQMCRENIFMPDLFDRLNIRHIHIAPLRRAPMTWRCLCDFLPTNTRPR